MGTLVGTIFNTELRHNLKLRVAVWSAKQILHASALLFPV